MLTAPLRWQSPAKGGHELLITRLAITCTRWTRTSSLRPTSRVRSRTTYLRQMYVPYVPYARTQVKSTSGTTVLTSIATPLRPYHVQFLRAPTLIRTRTPHPSFEANCKKWTRALDPKPGHVGQKRFKHEDRD